MIFLKSKKFSYLELKNANISKFTSQISFYQYFFRGETGTAKSLVAKIHPSVFLLKHTLNAGVRQHAQNVYINIK